MTQSNAKKILEAQGFQVKTTTEPRSLNKFQQLNAVRIQGVIPPPVPLDQAMSQNLLDEEDRDMVLNALCFFTVSFLMLPRRMQGQDFRQDYLAGASRLWAARISSLGLTDFVGSLKTSTEAVSIGETRGIA